MSVVDAPQHVRELLAKLHSLSLDQEKNLDRDKARAMGFDNAMRDKFIALDQDKCEYTYQLIRAIKPKTVLEMGTSFGVSTIYLALAVSQNGNGGTVIATENEPTKIEQAKKYWTEAGQDVLSTIKLREGDFHKTLTVDLPEIDFVLFDIALDALKIIEPSLKSGTLLLVDNVSANVERYKDFMDYLDASTRFRRLTVPFSGGLEQVLYV